MKRLITIFVLGVFLFGAASCAWSEEKKEKGWFGKNLFPIGSMVKEGVQKAMKGLAGEVERRIMEAIIPETGIGGGPQVNLYYPQLKAVNSRLSGMGLFHPLAGGFLPGGTLRYSITPEIQVGYTGAIMSYSTTGTAAADTTYITGVSLKGQMHSLNFVYKPKLKFKFRFYAGAEIGGVWATYTEDSGYRGVAREVKSWSGSSFMAIPFVGIQYCFDRLFALGIDYGYVFATIQPEGMKPQAGTSINGSCPQIDLSGHMVRFGPQIHF